ncbi:MAG: hypothetical protein P8H62_04625 [Henriciella sp.]|nr:hypothetical protein [Henriciella sp.]
MSSWIGRDLTGFEIVLFGICSCLVIVLYLVIKLLRSAEANFRPTNAPYDLRKQLLGAPNYFDLNNDMLMFVARDFIVQTMHGFDRGNYYPPDDVVDRLQAYQEFLLPHVSQLNALGFSRVGWFTKWLILNDENNYKYINKEGSFDCVTVSAIAEVAYIFDQYSDIDEFNSEIEQDISNEIKFG